MYGNAVIDPNREIDGINLFWPLYLSCKFNIYYKQMCASVLYNIFSGIIINCL